MNNFCPFISGLIKLPAEVAKSNTRSHSQFPIMGLIVTRTIIKSIKCMNG